MNIPEGFKLVPVEPTSEMVLAGINTELVETGDEDFDEQEDYRRVWRSMVEDAPTPPQPIFDEAKERELFNAWYGELPTTKLKETMWMAWEACAQSRAKAGEDE